MFIKCVDAKYMELNVFYDSGKTIVMLNLLLLNFFERDLRRLVEEVDLFENEGDLWRTQGSVKNSSGNLVLHIIGGINYFIGAMLAETAYVRNRDQEFIIKGVERKVLITRLEELIPMITKTINALDMDTEYPIILTMKNVQ